MPQGASPVAPVTRKRIVSLMDESASRAVRTTLRERVLRIVQRKKTCDTEVLLKACASYSWNEVFLEIDRLSRSGELCLFYKEDGDYAVRLPPTRESVH
jgi:hypothetical protein